jgi:hypothetical protein
MGRTGWPLHEIIFDTYFNMSCLWEWQNIHICGNYLQKMLQNAKDKHQLGVVQSPQGGGYKPRTSATKSIIWPLGHMRPYYGTQVSDNDDEWVRCCAHYPMTHIQGFARSPWMLPSGKLAPCQPGGLNGYQFWKEKKAKNCLLLATKRTKHLVASDFCSPKGHLTQAHTLGAASCVERWDATIGARELSNIFRYSAQLEWVGIDEHL